MITPFDPTILSHLTHLTSLHGISSEVVSMTSLQGCTLRLLALQTNRLQEPSSLRSGAPHLTFLRLEGLGNQIMADFTSASQPRDSEFVKALSRLVELRILQVTPARPVRGGPVAGATFQKLISELMPWLHWNQWYSGRSP